MATIDVHAHYGEWAQPTKAHIGDILIHFLDKYDIEKTVISSAKAIVHDFREGNRELCEFMKEDPRLYGYIVINPNYLKESLEEIEKYMSFDSKFIGLKLHPGYCGVSISSDKTIEILEAACHYSLPILVHTWSDPTSDPRNVIDVNKRFPDLKVLVGHMGGPIWKHRIDIALETNENVYLEICASFGDVGQVSEAVKVAGANRVLFGTDMTLFEPSWGFGKVDAAKLSDEDKHRVLYQNAKELFKF